MKRLYRSKTNRVIFGICGGIGEYLNIDPTVIRVVYIILTVATFSFASLVYLLLLLVIPE